LDKKLPRETSTQKKSLIRVSDIISLTRSFIIKSLSDMEKTNYEVDKQSAFSNSLLRAPHAKNNINYLSSSANL